MALAPLGIDKTIDVWIKLVSNQSGLQWAAWLAWLVSLSVVVAILCAFYYFYFVKKDMKFVSAGIISGIVVTVVIEVLKRVFLRPRPDASDLFSFPSRHAALAFMLAWLAIQQNPKSKARYLLIPWAIAVAFSRLWLEQHYLSDVLFGAFIGIFAAFVAYNYYKNKTSSRRTGKRKF